MKSEITSEKSIFSLKFPKLMELKKKTPHGNVIVLFSDENHGVAVYEDGQICYEIGHYASDWIMDDFQDFTGSVTLSN